MCYVYNRIFATQKRSIEEIETFLVSNELRLDKGVTDFIEVRLNNQIVACGGVDHNIIKCVAIAEQCRGEGVSLRLMTELLNLAASNGYSDLFLFTKPKNIELFSPCGFYPLVQYKDLIVLMENSPDRLQRYCESLKEYMQAGSKIGSIVMNANPFTLGHHYLVEYAASHCDWLHVFLVKEDASFFHYKDRYELVKGGIAGIANVTLHEGSDYVISKASFPNYFLKEEKDAEAGYTAIDLKLFRNYIAPALRINYRFVGTEPIDPVTNQYNTDMRYYLFEEPSAYPKIEVVEIPRLNNEAGVVSATQVRKALAIKDFDTIKKLVPDTTYQFLVAHYRESK